VGSSMGQVGAEGAHVARVPLPLLRAAQIVVELWAAGTNALATRFPEVRVRWRRKSISLLSVPGVHRAESTDLAVEPLPPQACHNPRSPRIPSC
jgi:hypothetical protein